MNEIERLRQIDDDIFTEYQNYFQQTTSSNFAKSYPRTMFIIQMLDVGANFIKNGILDCAEQDNYYALKILYRSLIEHYLKFQVIFSQFGKTKSDQFAESYLEYGEAREVLDALRADVSEHQLYDPNFKIANWDSFLSQHPMFENKTRKQIDAEAEKYTLKNMVRFHAVEYCSDSLSAALGKYIIEYAKLSSFVHGGAGAYNEVLKMNDDERIQEYERLCGLAIQKSCTIKLFTLLLIYQSNPEFGVHYNHLDALFKKIAVGRSS